ncbi:hypothetical protein [Streptomyces globisporus]
MSEESNPISSLWPLVSSEAADWLLELCGDGITGFMPPAMPDAVWVLNAMYEHKQVPADVSYHEYHQARLADGSVQPHVVGGIDFDAVGIATGGGLGRSQHPGPGRRRLRRAEPARRTGDPVVPSEADFSPSNLWAEDRSWVLRTDYDLWGTKVAGPPALIDALLNDRQIEAVRLPWAH